MVIEILQRSDALPFEKEARKKETARRRAAQEERQRLGEAKERDSIPFRGGVTLIVGMDRDEYIVRYAIQKRPDSESRRARQRDFLLRAGAAGSSEVAEYSTDGLPAGWNTQDAVRKGWLAGRTSNLEDMRASSCACRRSRMDGTEKKAALNEPFALLHRG